jgi:hypothetical protein
MLGDSEYGPIIDKALTLLRQAGEEGLSLNFIHRKLNPRAERIMVELLLDEMELAGMVRVVLTPPPIGHGGRTKTRYHYVG